MSHADMLLAYVTLLRPLTLRRGAAAITFRRRCLRCFRCQPRFRRRQVTLMLLDYFDAFRRSCHFR